jgi:16S rRNA (guanine(966)-N(2))-methyltransferase RsmD
MKIISGKLGGRTIISPDHRTTHPMSQKMRGAIFSSLGDITGLSFLDAFSGSGAIAFEAYSRGAINITAIDKSYYSQQAFITNEKSLNIKKLIDFKKMSVESWLKTNQYKFDIIVADPPYDKVNYQTISLLTTILAQKGVFVLSWPAKQTIPEVNIKEIKRKIFGDSLLVFYQLQ